MSDPQTTRALPSEFAVAVQEYYSQKADYDRLFDEFIDEIQGSAKEPSQESSVAQNINKQTEPSAKTQSYSLPLRKQVGMPSDRDQDGPAPGEITDHVAKESRDSVASTHDNHNVSIPGKGYDASKPKASAADHNATPGLVKADNLPEPASKDELRKRAEELNK